MSVRRPKIVVLGMMSKMPVAGVVWQNVHYLVGLERLGYEVYYVEAHARTPSMLMEHELDDSSVRAAAFIDKVMTRFNLRGRWAFHALHDDRRCYGLSEERLRHLYREAELIVNLHGGTMPLPEHAAGGRLVYLETDPVQLQIELHDGMESTIEFLEPHVAFFTFAENYGKPDCLLPVSDRFEFRPTRQPVVLDFWERRDEGPAEIFTTVGNWKQRWRTIRLGGETYTWSKHSEFLRFLELPARTGQPFELALSGIDDDERRLLESKGWRVRRALEFSIDLDAYRAYITESRGEFTVAKDQNVRLRTGWFSDRSATYLAAGRPVVTQDTRFDVELPTGDGLLACSTLEEAVEAVERVDADYERHRRAAAEIAREHFDAEAVLGRMLSDLGLPVPAGTGSRPESRVSVVVPCFNLGEYVIEAVQSALRQTRPPLEVIIVDDGSTDERTLAALEECGRRGASVYRTENRGAPAARNFGVERARGDYVVCLDADDVLLPRFLERTVPVLDASPHVGVVTTHVEFFGAMDGIWRPPDYDAVQLLWRNCIASASLFRRRCWEEAGGYADLPACQDWSFWISVVERGWRWAVVPEALYRYRRRSGSISQHREAHREEVLRELVALHAPTYRERVADVVVGMDAELRRTAGTLARFRADNRVKDDRIAALDREVAALRAELETRDGEAGAERAARLVASLPANATLMIVGRDDDAEPIDAGGRETLDFPRVFSGAEALVFLEELQARGGEYLLVPRTSLAWLDRCGALRAELEARYLQLAGPDDGCLLFDTTPYRTFSVVVCTYNRSALLREAIESLFAQEYPHDRFEIVVVDNGSDDDTEEVVRELRARSPVPLAYHVERQNGLSFCRNLGIRASRNEFVAYLDDDAVASPTWLRAFNWVINRHHALVVGGRVEKAFEPGFDVPAWFQFQYMKGFFGLNYRDWGKTERVFQIRYPRYISGGNSAYARRLFERFGGFPTALGRDRKTLLAAEESYLNLCLDRAGVTIFYTDDAVVHHFVDRRRLRRRHLLRKAYWSGISNALMYTRLLGYLETLVRARAGVAESRRLAGRIARSPRDAESFSRACRIVYNLSFLWKLARLGARTALRLGPPPPSEETAGGIEEWTREVERWPESNGKYRHLHELYAAQGDERSAGAALVRLGERLLRLHRAGLDAEDGLDSLWEPLRRQAYERLVERVGDAVRAATPPDATVGVVSRGDDVLLAACGREAWHFPQTEEGVYAGHHPADDADAVRRLEALRAQGAEYLVFPSTTSWWLEHYAGLREHLERSGRAVVRDERTCVIYALSDHAAGDDEARVASRGMVSR